MLLRWTWIGALLRIFFQTSRGGEFKFYLQIKSHITS